MFDAPVGVYPETETADSLARADALEREITELCAHINAAGYRLLQLIAELDDQQTWGAWGLKSCAHFLNWRCGIGLNAAREKVRAAHALRQLPLISAAFASGELSFSRVRALTRVAEPGNERELLTLARHATAMQVEKLVRGYRRVARTEEHEQAAARQASRELNYYYDDDGCLVIRARLPAEDGETVIKALDAALAALREEEDDCEPEDVTAVTPEPVDRFARRRADALTLLAETTLRHGPAPLTPGERYQVVLHVTEETLCDDADGRCEMESGMRLALDTARRIACDSSVVRITEDAAGNPLDIGRKTRTISPALRRALRARDAGCRFPGCTQHRFVEAHHVEHWADGGETSIDNLLLLCRHHHRLVHEGGFGLAKTADGGVRFTRPDGNHIEAHPRMPANGSVDGLRRGNRGTGVDIDASTWIVPGDPLDYGIAIEGLLRLRERESCRGQAVGSRFNQSVRLGVDSPTEHKRSLGQ